MKSSRQVIFANLPSEFGRFQIYSFPSQEHIEPNLVLLSESFDPHSIKTPYVRLHSECMTGDVFGSLRCDCRFQLISSLEMIDNHGGLLIYLRQEGRGIGINEKIKAYKLQEQGQDSVEANLSLGHQADLRSYGEAIEILKYFEVSKLNLISNNPQNSNQFRMPGFKLWNTSI
ncbi:MAG: GTP cyclohydrolase II [Saprospiraceae bacterium]|nr:GTP cyclohydrolase II [Saprospiraceae bacterium]